MRTYAPRKRRICPPPVRALYAGGRRFMARARQRCTVARRLPQRAVREADMRERRLYLCGENRARFARHSYFMGPGARVRGPGRRMAARRAYGVVHRLCSPGRMKGAATAAALLFCGRPGRAAAPPGRFY